MFCESCRSHRPPWRGMSPVFCEVCGGRLVRSAPAELAGTRDRLRYLLDELRGWAAAGRIDPALAEQLSQPYAVELAAIAAGDEAAASAARPPAPSCHDAADMPGRFCPDCGARVTANEGTATAEVGAPAMRAGQALAPAGPAVAGAGALVAEVSASAEAAARESEAVLDSTGASVSVAGVRAAVEAAARESETTTGPVSTASGAFAAFASDERGAEAAPVPGRRERLLRELRPVFYENLILFLGAFLVFAGSIYFAVYFWGRLGAFGPLVAGGLLGAYGLGFAATGYLLQRRYRAELSARVLYGIATAILPVAATLLGEPVRTAGAGVAAIAAACVVAFGAAAYPAIAVAASLFQREIGAPFARVFVVLLWWIGLSPLIARAGVRALDIAAVYAAVVPVAAMYRRVREVGRVFERGTVVYVVGGSAYLVAVAAARLGLAMAPGLAAAELGPLVVAMAVAAIDLDVAWRERSHAARSALGVVGVLAQASAVLAIAMALPVPGWRVATTLAAGMVFAVTALRHRRAMALHVAIGAMVAGLSMVVWLPGARPPHAVAMSGVLLLALAAGLARLARRWRRHAATEFAAPCELWAALCAVLAAIATPLTLIGARWRVPPLGVYGPSLIVLPLCMAVMALAWWWGRRRAHLAAAAVAAAATALTALCAAEAHAVLLVPATAAAAAVLVAAAAAGIPRRFRGEASPALIDAAVIVLVAAAVLPVVCWLGPWFDASAAESAASFAAIAGAAVAVASQRRARAIGAVAVVAGALATAAVLWPFVPAALVPGLVALGLLLVDRLAGTTVIGAGRPFRDAYAVGAVALALQAVAVGGIAAFDQVASAPGLALLALGLGAIAARNRRPWPVYAAVGCLLAGAWGAPAALDLAVRPRIAVEAVGLAIAAAALALRAVPRLHAWRVVFLDVPIHLTALGAPLVLVRFAVSFAAWEAGAGSPGALPRRLASALGLAVIAAILHGSRAHAYLASAAAMLVLPAVAAAAGLGSDAVAPALAASAVLSWGAAVALARRPGAAAAVARGDRPLALFERWALPSAATWRALWSPAIAALGGCAALAAGALALAESLAAWPAGSLAVVATCALIAGYAVLRCAALGEGAWRGVRLAAAHAACAAVALGSVAAAHVLGEQPRGAGALMLGAGYLVLGEGLGRVRHAAARAAAPAAYAWAIACALVPLTALIDLARATTPLAGALLAVAVVRASRGATAGVGRVVRSVAVMVAAGFAALWPIAAIGWLDPPGLAVAALAATCALGAWGHWWTRDLAQAGAVSGARAGAPTGSAAGAATGFTVGSLALASGWAGVAAGLAVAATVVDAPALAPALLSIGLGLGSLALLVAWFGFAAIRSGRAAYGHAAQAALIALYACARLSPLGDGVTAETDVVVAIGFAFALHFVAELLERARLLGLAQPAVLGARALPVAACLIAVWLALSGGGALATLRHAAFAEALGVLYTLGFRRGGHRGLGAVALGFYNAGLVLLWISTDRGDALYYTIPAGISISFLARIYRSNMSRTARRGLRATGALVIYMSTFYQVVQFDQGSYALVLGGLSLAGIACGFFLQLRELFVLSIGFLVLDVASNLAYYGVHRPVLGWTLLTLAGLCLTASGIAFQLRRGQVRGVIAGVRATLADWD